jgi:3-oxoacyl-[acyl-carrier-protein] synthase-1
MILSDGICTFDENRKGLNLGEAAAYLVLESDQVIEKEKRSTRSSNWLLIPMTYHQTASLPDGEGASIWL